MRMKKIMSLGLALTMATLTLTGCGEQTDTANVTEVAPLTFEEVASDKANTGLTAVEKESMIYRYMSDDISIDTTKLLPVGSNSAEYNDIVAFVSDVNTYLTNGNCENEELSSELINYMLMEFSKTPYEWTQSPTGIQVVGMDPATRLMFVDVEYTTSSTKKEILPDSAIVKGHPMEEILLKARYDEWIAYLDEKMEGDEKADELYDTFVEHWGDPDEIIEAQNTYTLTERIAKFGNTTKGIGKYTYSGLVENENANTGATMTFRFILNYKFNLGQKRGLEVKALYLKDYKTANCDTLTALPTVSDTTGLEVIEPYITRLLNSFRKAVDETNHIGLYQLFSDYSKLDKYYVDYGSYTYNKSGGFTYDIIDRTDETLTIRIYRTQKVRAKGSYMSYPSYKEILIGEVQLCDDDRIRFNNLTLLSSEMTGEPVSVIKNVEGVSEQMLFSSVEFTEENEKAIEQLIKDFSVYQLNQNISAETFSNIIDTGITADALDGIKKTVAAIQANEKVTWVSSYITKTNSYVEVKLREVYLADISNYDTESVLSMINRDGVWKVIGYTRTLNVPTTRSEINDTYSLCRTVKGATESIDTEATGTENESGETEGNVTDTSGTVTEPVESTTTTSTSDTTVSEPEETEPNESEPVEDTSSNESSTDENTSTNESNVDENTSTSESVVEDTTSSEPTGETEGNTSDTNESVNSNTEASNESEEVEW